MTRFCVNATKSVPAWIYVEADSPEAALDAARAHDARDYDSDDFAGWIDFNVTPTVKAEPA